MLGEWEGGWLLMLRLSYWDGSELLLEAEERFSVPVHPVVVGTMSGRKHDVSEQSPTNHNTTTIIPHNDGLVAFSALHAMDSCNVRNKAMLE